MLKRIWLSIVIALAITTVARAEDYIYEDDVAQMCEMVAAEHGNLISPEWLQAVAWKESRYDADAENGNCKGLCQINPYVWKDLVDEYGGDVMNPYTNLSIACRILTMLYEQSPEDPYWVLMHYNMKQNTADRMYAEGRYTSYAVKIMEKTAELEQAHGKWVLIPLE